MTDTGEYEALYKKVYGAMNPLMQLIKQVREKTNAPISLIKEALNQSKEASESIPGIDRVAEAVEWLKDNWKPKDKETAFSRIYTYVHQGRVGVMLEMCCGTDFVANTPKFEMLSKEIMYQIAAGLDDPLETQVSIRDSSKTVQDMMSQVSKETGETIKIGRYIRWVAGT